MKDIDQVLVDFNSNARKLLAFLLSQFMSNVHQINRRENENVFQQLQARYTNSFKDQLEALAKNLIHKYRAVDEQQLNNRLRNNIAIYLQEFLQQTKSL
jgi:hypothetical protein